MKRMDRILDKLLRFPTMRLSQMDDIGGCRLVLRTLDDVYLVTDRINRRWPHAEILDYIDAPKPDGYRSVHVVERRDGRLVEVQLRTRRQHDWAEAVEDARGLTGYDVKNGMGPVALRRYFRVAAHRLALEDAGQPPDPEIEKDFGSLIEQVRSYYAGAR